MFTNKFIYKFSAIIIISAGEYGVRFKWTSEKWL